MDSSPLADNDDLRTRLEVDRKDLLDLSLRNPLLNYRPRARGLEFVGESPIELFRILVREGKGMSFLPAPAVQREATSDQTDDAPTLGLPTANPTDLKLQTTLPPEDLQARLLAIYLAARTAVEEQGINTLFLALGMLTWFEDDASPRPLRAPLILIPVELERSSARERFRLRHDGKDLDDNLSLAEKLRADFGIDLPELPDGDDLDVAGYFDAVAESIQDQPRWSLGREAAVLGFFSFSKFLMYRDLDETSWPRGSKPGEHPIVRALLGDGFPEPRPESDEDERWDRLPGAADLRFVVDADGTQSLALLDAATGGNLVIQGPPGTGKSQTITNLIADAVGRGKTVLFVAEKLAALEVVKHRLDGVGLGQACLELHSHKIGKKAVLDQVRRTLGAARPKPNPTDESPRRDELRRRLDAYCEAINEPIGSSGLTPHQAIGERLQIVKDWAGFDPTQLDIPTLPDWSAADYRRRLDLVERFNRDCRPRAVYGSIPSSGVGGRPGSRGMRTGSASGSGWRGTPRPPRARRPRPSPASSDSRRPRPRPRANPSCARPGWPSSRRDGRASRSGANGSRARRTSGNSSEPAKPWPGCTVGSTRHSCPTPGPLIRARSARS